MLTNWKVTSVWRSLPVRAQVHIRRTVGATYLAVVRCGIDVENDQEKYHVDESGQACDRIDLPKETDKARAVQHEMRLSTDHYRPAVRSMPSDDTPLVVKSGDKLPARGGEPIYYCWTCCEAASGADSHVETSQGMPELRDCHCRRIGFLSSRAWQ